MFLHLKHISRPGDQNRDLTDERLIDLYLQSGDREVMGELFERYTHLVYGICLRYLGDHEQSRDAVMDIFEDLFIKLRRHKISCFKNWLYSVSRNHCLMILRRSGNYARAREHFGPEAGDFSTVPEIVEEPDITGYLSAAVDRLNTDQGLCIRLMYFQEKSYRDIAEITGMTLNQVKSHIQNGKRNLKNYLLSCYESQPT
jgi:RNA polymerase sigma-70 factor (ECF subfamily)